MAKSEVAYKNLRAEMARKGLCIKDIALACGYNRDTLSRKLRRVSPISLLEACNIRATVFPDLNTLYLFQEDNDGKEVDQNASLHHTVP